MAGMRRATNGAGLPHIPRSTAEVELKLAKSDNKTSETFIMQEWIPQSEVGELLMT